MLCVPQSDSNLKTQIVPDSGNKLNYAQWVADFNQFYIIKLQSWIQNKTDYEG